MEKDEKLVKAEEESAKAIFTNDKKLIRPVVVSPLSGNPKTGKGWSIGELKAAAMTRKQLRSLHLQIDKFRKTSHADNVELLKKIKTIQ